MVFSQIGKFTKCVGDKKLIAYINSYCFILLCEEFLTQNQQTFQSGCFLVWLTSILPTYTAKGVLQR